MTVCGIVGLDHWLLTLFCDWPFCCRRQTRWPGSCSVGNSDVNCESKMVCSKRTQLGYPWHHHYLQCTHSQSVEIILISSLIQITVHITVKNHRKTHITVEDIARIFKYLYLKKERNDKLKCRQRDVNLFLDISILLHFILLNCQASGWVCFYWSSKHISFLLLNLFSTLCLKYKIKINVIFTCISGHTPIFIIQTYSTRFTRIITSVQEDKSLGSKNTPKRIFPTCFLGIYLICFVILLLLYRCSHHLTGVNAAGLLSNKTNAQLGNEAECRVIRCFSRVAQPLPANRVVVPTPSPSGRGNLVQPTNGHLKSAWTLARRTRHPFPVSLKPVSCLRPKASHPQPLASSPTHHLPLSSLPSVPPIQSFIVLEKFCDV